MKCNVFKATILFFLLIAVHAPFVRAAQYTFIQTGFANGGFVKGSFDGVDNGNIGQDFPAPGFAGDGVIELCRSQFCLANGIYPLEEAANVQLYFGGNDKFDELNGILGGNVSYLYFTLSSNQLYIEKNVWNSESGFPPGHPDTYPLYVYSSAHGVTIDLSPDDDGFEHYSGGRINVFETPIPGTLPLFAAGSLGLLRLRRKEPVKNKWKPCGCRRIKMDWL